MIRQISEFLIGLVFGFGLLLSGMTDPGKVIGFLDVGGLWDPSLAFVMGGAVVISFFAFRIARGWPASLFGRVIMLTDLKTIDFRLVVGSALFGIGWGLSGFCPGPAIVSLGTGEGIVSLGTGEGKAFVFVLAMGIGMAIEAYLDRRTRA